MNRVIEFKAWHIDAKIMLYGTPKEVFQWVEDGQPVIPLQFTGLTDKNGKKIFEGDIRVAKYYCGDEQVTTYNTMVWDNENACFYWQGREIPDWADMGVIGNIYENPNLCNS
jgi:uncharacterized phage protein (TIGR01671 family)